MKEKLIKVAIVEPLQEPKLVEITNELSSLQNIVGGLIQVVVEPITGFDVVIDDEGKFREQPLNRKLGEYDVLVGTFFVTKADKNREFTSLTSNDFEQVKQVFGLNSKLYPALIGTWGGM